MEILVKFPTRGRREKFFGTLACWQGLLSGRQRVRFLVTVDADDPTMNDPAVLSRLAVLPATAFQVSGARSKIEAVNWGMADQSFDVVVVASDDMVPEVASYDAVIAADMALVFPGLDGLLHYNDGSRGTEVCTLTVMGRELFRRLGSLYHPGYKSLWCDNELTEVARLLGKWWYSPRVLVRHAHPSVVGGPSDDLLVRNDAFEPRDRDTFHRRRERLFDLPAADTVGVLPRHQAARQLSRAWECRRSGDGAEAERLAREVLCLRPLFAPAHQLLGTLALDSGDLDTAVASFEEAVRLHPGHGPYHYALGRVHSARRNPAAAAAAFQAAVRLQPEDVHAHAELGLALIDLGMVNEAVQSLQRAVGLRPDDAGGHCNLGNAMALQGRYREAQAAYQRALSLQPDFSEVVANLSNLVPSAGRRQRPS